MPASTRRRASPLLFKWDPLSMGLDYQGNPWAISSNKVITGSFDRGGTVGSASSVDANGKLFFPGYKHARWYHSYDATTGLWLPRGIRLEGARTNLCLQSENFGTTWTTSGTPTRSAAAHTAAGVSLDLLGDDDGAVQEDYIQNITFTGDAVKAVSVFLKQGTSAPAGGSMIQLRDTSAGANRLLATVTWVASAPSVVMTTGTHLGTERMKDGVYRLLFATTSVTAANTNRIAVVMCAVVAETGNIYAGGVQAENATFPSSYIPTTTVAVTRSADTLSFAFNAVPQVMTVYADIWELGTALGSSGAVIHIGTGGAAVTEPGFVIDATASKYRIYADFTSGSAQAQQPAAAPTFNAQCELRGVMDAAATGLTIGQTISGGTEAALTNATARALDTAWSAATLSIGSYSGGAAGGFAAYKSVKIAAGVKTLAQMRAA